MSKKKIVTLLLASVLVVAGIVLFLVGACGFNFDMTQLSVGSHETNTYELQESFRNISVDVDTADVIFVRSQDGKCKVVCKESSQQKHSVRIADNTLQIRLDDHRHWLDYILNLEQLEITVYLPADSYDRIGVDTDTGDVAIPAGFTAKEVAIQTDTGDILLDSQLCSGNIALETDNGDIELRDVVAQGQIRIESDTGDVSFKNCDALRINVETDTGDITGTLRTGKQFRAYSDTGDVEVPLSTGNGSCYLSSETGDISIRLSS